MSGKIVMIGSMKGGVSKTVTTFNLAYSLSKLGKKVLAVDFDSQANLSTCLGVENVTAVPVTIGNLMLAQIEEEELPERSEYIQTRNGVDYISSSMVLSAVDAKLRLEMGSEKMLSDILETLRDSYDYILIDTSPSLGALTINAMSAADEVLITVNPQLLAMMGLQDFLKTVKKIKNKVVADAIAEYRGMNDWLEHFLEECCVRGDGLEEKSGELYQEYRSYCLRTGEISRNNADFTAVLEKAGYTRKKKKTGMWVQGLQLKDTDFAE